MDAYTGLAWAADLGVGYRPRPKNSDLAGRSALIAALRGGLGKAQAASKFGLSIQTVTRVLRSVPGLRLAWLDASRNRARVASRRAWKKALAACTNLGINRARVFAPAAYAWLYRHDREWLEASNGVSRLARAAPRSPVDWRDRDRRFAAAIMSTIEALNKQDGRPGLNLQQIVQAVPGLAAKRGQLLKMPITRELLAAIKARKASKSTE